jgi:hypothetical protein
MVAWAAGLAYEAQYNTTTTTPPSVPFGRAISTITPLRESGNGLLPAGPGGTMYWYVITATFNRRETLGTEVFLSLLNPGAIELTWTSVVPHATAYNIYRGTSSGGETLLVRGLPANGTAINRFVDRGFPTGSATPPTAMLPIDCTGFQYLWLYAEISAVSSPPTQQAVIQVSYFEDAATTQLVATHQPKRYLCKSTAVAAAVRAPLTAIGSARPGAAC